MFRLSPYSLNLLENCPRCFWMSQVKNIKRPSKPMASLPIAMHSIISNYFNKYRHLNKLPPILNGQINGRLAISMPRTLQWDAGNGIILWGRPDDYFELENKSIVPFDHKTASKPPERVHPSYRLQLSVYWYLLKMMGYKTLVNKAYLAYYTPDDCELHNGMPFHCTVVEVNIENHDLIKQLIFKAVDILNRPSIPEQGEQCQFCTWTRQIQEQTGNG